MADRLSGLVLFLPVPVVLFLLTRAPLGIAWSLLVGVVLVVTHRLYARPFALARASRRCLWCGGAARDGPALVIEEAIATTRWRACSEGHAERTRRFLGWADEHRRFLRVGILGTLAAFAVAAAGTAAHAEGARYYPDVVSAFRLGIAATVLPLGLLASRRPSREGPLRSPFPVHIQALIGTWAVAWLFRLVGVVWLALALAHFAGRLPALPSAS